MQIQSIAGDTVVNIPNQPAAGSQQPIPRWTIKRGAAAVTLPVTVPVLLTTSVVMIPISVLCCLCISGVDVCESATPPQGIPIEYATMPITYPLKGAKNLILYVWKGN